MAVGAATAVAQSTTEIAIPYEKFVLDNGLTLIVHEDHKAPIITVNVWYHVGSKNEKPGRTGFAHLFEHLMFNGSEHYNDDYFKVLEPLGATDLNGTTNNDRTNYFQNVPTPALDVALWMESDRMGHLLGAIDQAKLDEQRGVVQNEKRQGENQPYGRVGITVTENTYPAGHPYSWSVIGSMEDLDAASLEDVQQWFKTYYGAANAVIAIAGDIDPQTAKAKVEQYFGDIPSGPPVAKHDVWIAKRAGAHRQIMQDRVPQARIYKVWNIPEWASEEARYLDLVTDVLAAGKTSRFYKRLVYDEQIATDVAAFVSLREIGGQLRIQGTARPGVDLDDVERALDEELARFLAEGPTEAELQRVKTQFRARFIRGIERIGGFGGKSDVLAMNEIYGGSPDFYKTTLERVANATAEDLRTTAEKWLSDGVYILEVHPFPEYTTVASEVDRSKVPEAGAPASAKFPELQRTTLSNGLQVVLAERHAVPVVNFRLLVDAGYAADQHGIPGAASLALSMLDEGTRRRSALEISEELALLGASLGASSNLDMSQVSLSALQENLDASLDIFADVILNPSFPEADFQRLKRQRLAQIQQEKVQPIGVALRVFSRLLYGEGHAYGNPLTGSGTEESVQRITREDLAEFHQTWFKPNNATLVVVGATTIDEIQPTLERLFRNWRRGNVPQKNLATVPQKQRSAVYLMNRPGAIQSVIFAGHVAPPKANPDEIAIETMNTLLGGNFTARINMNLREDKHWSYGAGSIFWDARGQRPFFVYAPVQSDKTKESMYEVAKELQGILGEKPATSEELSMAVASQTLTLPGSWETANAVASSIAQIVRFGLDDQYFETYADNVRGLKLRQIQSAAANVIYPDKLVWVVVGDREKIEAGIRELGLGPMYEIDADGNVKGEVGTR
ncbi:MAG: insulinase family protein [Gemmatimonadales bacterium]|nr:insulinase family protein [Gemmatimonadales bacterium]NIN13405.1 insulinase family protein [Gemmatimonadales bacterium]NIN51408.1 insulinase family protein [Gemmatimonadales bacterium]NIP08872.1 insulinase family protein [Gemmatimonadales bacterium]NIQ99866.1 insulinase family protein [Gemmatimonadales bacterium]